MKTPYGISPCIYQALLDCGHPWEVRLGRLHVHIYVGGKFIGIAPLGGSREGSPTSDLNLRASIRREARALQSPTSGRQHRGRA